MDRTTERDDRHLPLPERADLVVIGAGLAGLTAAAVAERAGAWTVVLDAHAGGGRAAVRRVPLDGVDGEAVFNAGPRALYVGGAGAAVLRRLGIRAYGAKPPTRGNAVLLGPQLDRMPTGPVTMARTGVVARWSKPRLLAALVPLVSGRARAGRGDESAAAWIARRCRGRDDVAAMVAALFRVATYTADLDELSADAAVAQVGLAVRRGVLYLDGGFQQLLDELDEAAGAAVHPHCPVVAVRADPGGGWTVTCGDGREVRSEAVVIAAGGPAVAASLLDRPDIVERVGPPVTAACLELAVAGPVPTRFVLGVDEPLYLSEHAPPADLAPPGVRVVQLARYGSTSPESDRAQLEALAVTAGIEPDRVVARRFLRRMVVQTAMPSVHHGGLRGRPAVAVAERPGVFLSGDWVGPVGMLADASLASGEVAGRLAASHARSVVESARSAHRPAGTVRSVRT